MWSALRQEASPPAASASAAGNESNTAAASPNVAPDDDIGVSDGGNRDGGTDGRNTSNENQMTLPDDLEYVAAVSALPDDDDCDYDTADEQRHHDNVGNESGEEMFVDAATANDGNDQDESGTLSQTSAQSIVNGGDEDDHDEEDTAAADVAEHDVSENDADDNEAEADASFQAPDSILHFLAEAESNLNAVLADDAIGSSTNANANNGAKIEYYDSDEDVTTNKLGEELRRARLHEVLAANGNNNAGHVEGGGDGPMATPEGRTPLPDGGGSTEVCIDGSAASLSTRNAVAAASNPNAIADGADDVLSPMAATALFSPPRTRRGTRYSTSNNATAANANANAGRRSTMGVGRLSTGSAASTAAEDEALVVAAHQRQIMETFDDSDDLPLVAEDGSDEVGEGGGEHALVVDEDVIADDTADAGSSDMDVDESATMVESLPDVMQDEEEESAMAESLPDIESEVGEEDDDDMEDQEMMKEGEGEEETSDDAIIRQLEEALLDQERFAAEERAAAEASRAAAAEARRLEKGRLLDEPAIPEEEQEGEAGSDEDSVIIHDENEEYDPDEIIARIEEEDRLEQERLAAIAAEEVSRLAAEKAAAEAERLEQERIAAEEVSIFSSLALCKNCPLLGNDHTH